MKNKRVGGALIVGTVLILSAVVFAKPKASDPLAAAIVVADAPRTYQETKDTDADGLRDWEEELYGTNPLVPDAPIAPATTTEDTRETLEDIPDTFTHRFAIDFFSDFFMQGGADMDETAQGALLNQSVQEVINNTKDRFFTTADLTVASAEDLSSVREYGNNVAAILTRYPVPEENEMLILERALQTDNGEELKKLEPILDSYKKTIRDLIALAVPPSLVNEHLNLLNAILAVHNDVVVMRNAFDDALPALIRVQRYQNDVDGLYIVLNNMYQALTKAGAVYRQEESGSFFLQFQL